MSLTIDYDLTLSISEINENSGLLCYRNIVTTNNISATSEIARHPITNAANPATAYRWEASDASDQTITIDNTQGEEVDYIGIARHNLNQDGAELRVRFNGVTVRDWLPVANFQALLYILAGAKPTTIQIDIRGLTTAATIAVLYVGKSLRLERNIYVNHTPIVYGRNRRSITGVSQSGQYLGEVVLNQTLTTAVNLTNLTPTWYRAELDPFFGRDNRHPCFWAWRPAKYPTEVGYCWVVGNPRPVNSRSNGMMSISWNFEGLA